MACARLGLDLIVVSVLAAASMAAQAGPLTPPAGPVAPTPGPEPRVAINSANTPGDPNSRFRIINPGSYYLAGNLTGIAGDSGIEIAASNVTIDLMGFAVTGVALTLDGITTDGVRDNITIRNGTITNWGSDGINLTTGGTGDGYRIEGVTASDNGGHGFRLGNRAVLRSAIATSNGDDGFNLSSNAALSDCVASLNGARGFTVGSSSTLTGCTASNNTAEGFFLVANATATNCTAISNAGRGFYVGLGGVISRCVASSNSGDGIYAIGDGTSISGCTVRDNDADGIEVTAMSSVADNICSGNGSAAGDHAGIHVTGSRNRIDGNICTNNDAGIYVESNSNFITRNICGDNLPNFELVAGNFYGIIVFRSSFLNGGPAVGPGMQPGAGAIGTSDPYANFTED